MIQSYQKAIDSYKSGNKLVMKEHPWLMYIALTQEKHVNLERVPTKRNISKQFVLDYVERSLKILSQCSISDQTRDLIATVLVWSEVAKTGLEHHRRAWLRNKYNIAVHNEGSADIFLGEMSKQRKGSIICLEPEYIELAAQLIRTHGLIGQYLRGEVLLKVHEPMMAEVRKVGFNEKEIFEVLYALNHCVIAAVDQGLWNELEEDVKIAIDHIIKGAWNKEFTLEERLIRLRKKSIEAGENYESYDVIAVEKPLRDLLNQCSLWYVEAALSEFSFEQFLKILCLSAYEISCRAKKGQFIENLSFEHMMNGIYYDFGHRKRINVYKKRIIEHFLKGIQLEEIIMGVIPSTPHIEGLFSTDERAGNTLFLDFIFSDPAQKLIDFCVAAEQSEVLYEKAILMLYDLFGLRHDAYDRFNQEENYLTTMNQAIDYKRVLTEYVVGKKVVDIGPGGGALMDLLTETFPKKEVVGIDISMNVIEALTKKKNLENKRWNVVHGNALNLKESFAKGEVDCIIFCSILHELFSYIEFEGKKFNHDTLKLALQSAFDILPVGGRIIIRDGIMSEPENQDRIIRFLTEEGMDYLKRYQEDFQGRRIEFELVGQNEVLMPINDAMEFLYTYTWGEKSYIHEIQEQFGYFTPSAYQEFVKEVLGEEAEIIVFRHFLQEGYTIALSPKIEFMSSEYQAVPLPDSTCIMVIEKK